MYRLKYKKKSNYPKENIANIALALVQPCFKLNKEWMESRQTQAKHWYTSTMACTNDSWFYELLKAFD